MEAAGAAALRVAVTRPGQPTVTVCSTGEWDWASSPLSVLAPGKSEVGAARIAMGFALIKGASGVVELLAIPARPFTPESVQSAQAGLDVLSVWLAGISIGFAKTTGGRTVQARPAPPFEDAMRDELARAASLSLSGGVIVASVPGAKALDPKVVSIIIRTVRAELRSVDSARAADGRRHCGGAREDDSRGSGEGRRARAGAARRAGAGARIAAGRARTCVISGRAGRLSRVACGRGPAASGSGVQLAREDEPMTFKERLGDRRSDMRFEIIGQLWGALEVVDYLPIKNLARGGALVEAQASIGAESFRALRFGFNGTTQEVTVRVRHVTARKTTDGDRYLVGLEFVDPSAAALDQIDRIIEARLAEMRPIPEA